MSTYSQVTPQPPSAEDNRQAHLRALYGDEPNVVDQEKVDWLIGIFGRYAAKEADKGYNKLVLVINQHRSDKHKVSLADIVVKPDHGR
jgi:hypothetical protein